MAGVNIGTGLDMSDSDSKSPQRTTFQNLQTEVKLSVAQTGGPPEANGFFDWKLAQLPTPNWYAIDRDFSWYLFGTLSYGHRDDFKDHLKVANA